MMETFKERLVSLCGASKAEFARRCEIGQTTMLAYLNGDSKPGLDALVQIADACNVRVGWLAAGELPKELKREVLEDEDSLDLIAAVGLIMEEKSLDQLQAFEDYKAWWDSNARKILKLPIREKIVNLAEPPQSHPALVMLAQWLTELSRTDPVRWAEILNTLRKALPDFDAWLEKKRSGNHHQVAEPRPKYNNAD